MQNLKLITSLKKIISLWDQGEIFCAVDTETTGVDPLKERIIEIGAVKFSKDGIIDTFSALINPRQPLSQYITDLTGITDEMLKNQPDSDTVIPKFRRFSKETVLVAHNAQFDLRFLNMESEKLNLLSLPNQAVDTLRLSRIMLPENESWKQTFLADQFKIDKGHAHRATDDAQVCAKLFPILIKLPVPSKKKRRRLAAIKETEKRPENSETSSLASSALE